MNEYSIKNKMPRSKEQFEEMRTKKKELILSAALTCFASNGFHNTSIADISAEAGISTGLMYNYFESKEELLKSIYVQGLELIFEPITGLKKPLSTKQLVGFLKHVFSQVESNPAYWRTYLIVISQPEILRDYHTYIHQTAEQGMLPLIQYFSDQGASDPLTEVRFLFSVIDGICLNYLADIANYPFKKIKQKIIRQYEE